jgi:hypothetical protein
MTDIFAAYCKIAKGTFLEEDRDSNFPSENTVSDPSPVTNQETQSSEENFDG